MSKSNEKTNAGTESGGIQPHSGHVQADSAGSMGVGVHGLPVLTGEQVARHDEQAREARYVRDRLSLPMVGMIGSVCKTGVSAMEYGASTRAAMVRRSLVTPDYRPTPAGYRVHAAGQPAYGSTPWAMDDDRTRTLLREIAARPWVGPVVLLYEAAACIRAYPYNGHGMAAKASTLAARVEAFADALCTDYPAQDSAPEAAPSVGDVLTTHDANRGLSFTGAYVRTFTPETGNPEPRHVVRLSDGSELSAPVSQWVAAKATPCEDCGAPWRGCTGCCSEGEPCDECGQTIPADTPSMVDPAHGAACSLNPANVAPESALIDSRADDRGVVEVFDADAYRKAHPDAQVVTCGGCGRSWDDSVVTAYTPAPSARCPFEYDHDEPDADHYPRTDDVAIVNVTDASVTHAERIETVDTLNDAGQDIADLPAIGSRVQFRPGSENPVGEVVNHQPDSGCVGVRFDGDAEVYPCAARDLNVAPATIETAPEPYAIGDMDAIVRQYVETALWSTPDHDTGRCLDAEHDAGDIDPAGMVSIRTDLYGFVSDPENGDALRAYVAHTGDESMIGHDFALNRDGHGAGFWDRGAGDAGQHLSEACKPYGESGLYVGDDGRVYVSGSETGPTCPTCNATGEDAGTTDRGQVWEFPCAHMGGGAVNADDIAREAA